jgi:hypothetical protein
MTPNQAIELLTKAPHTAFVELIITTNPLKETSSNNNLDKPKTNVDRRGKTGIVAYVVF